MELQPRSNRKRLVGFVALSAMLLAALACLCGPLSSLPNVGASLAATATLMSLNSGSTGGGSTSGDNSTGGSSDNSSGGSSTGSGGNGLTFVDPSKSSLKSYHSKFTMTFTGTKSDGTPDNGTFTLEESHTSDPDATSILMNGQGSAITSSNQGTTQMVKMGDNTYIVSNDDSGNPKCVSMSGSAGGAASGLVNPIFSPSTFFGGGDFNGAQRILPDDVINGIPSQHWQFTKATVGSLSGNWTSYTVDVWVATDGGYATKSTFVGDGQDISSGGGKGHAEWEFDLLEANSPDIKVDMPDGCTAPAGSDLPKMADAQNAISVAGMNTYTSASSAADVVAFYNQQMPAAGWTAGDTKTEGPVTTLTFTKGSQTATVTITEADGKTTVLIQVQ